MHPQQVTEVFPMMMNDVLATAAGSSPGPEGAERDRMAGSDMADFKFWDGTQASFRPSRGLSVKTFQGWASSGSCRILWAAALGFRVLSEAVSTRQRPLQRHAVVRYHGKTRAAFFRSALLTDSGDSRHTGRPPATPGCPCGVRNARRGSALPATTIRRSAGCTGAWTGW